MNAAGGRDKGAGKTVNLALRAGDRTALTPGACSTL